MVKKTRYGDFTFGWEKTLGNMEANAGELSHLESARLTLQRFLDRVTRLQYEQRYHEAARQQATAELQEALAEGEKVATFLRFGIKLQYGIDNDKLLEFGIQPLRRSSRQKRKKVAALKVTPEPMAPASEEDVLLEERPQPMNEDVHGAAHSLREEGKEPERPAVATVAIPAAAVSAPATGEGDGIGAVGVRLPGEEKDRAPTRTGEDGRTDERDPAGGEDRCRSEAAGQALAHPEQAEAMLRDGFDPPGRRRSGPLPPAPAISRPDSRGEL